MNLRKHLQTLAPSQVKICMQKSKVVFVQPLQNIKENIFQSARLDGTVACVPHRS